MSINSTTEESSSPEDAQIFEDGMRILAHMIAVKWMKTHARTIGASVAMPVSLDINLPKDRLTLSVSEVSKLLGLSRSATYEAIRQGQIPSIRFGKKILVSRVRLEMMLRESK